MKIVKSSELRRLGVRLVDLTLTSVAFAVSYWARTNYDALFGDAPFEFAIVNSTNVWQFAALLGTLLVVVWVTLDAVESSENMRLLRPLDEVFVAVRALTWSHVLLLAAASQYSRYAFSRGALVMLYPLTILFLGTWRALLKVWLSRLRASGRNFHRVAIVGAGDTGNLMRREIDLHPEYGYVISGFIDDDPAKIGTTIGDVPVVGPVARTAALTRKLGASDVLVAIPGVARPVLLDVIRQCEDERLAVSVVPSLADLATAAGPILHLGGIPILAARGEPIRGWGGVAKRIFDVVGSGLGILVLSPFLVTLALLIRLDTPGPALFRQNRVGRRGREFTMYKFRSMVIDAHEKRGEIEHLNEIEGGVTFKVKSDPRITRVGRWLRRFSLDELPQILNVFLGDMSLVGPRPPLVSEVDLYSHWVRKRLDAVPGMTGLWQVSGRSDIGFTKMVELDLFYIEHWSFALDLSILIRTIPAVLSGRGAY